MKTGSTLPTQTSAAGSEKTSATGADAHRVQGEFTSIGGESWYRIRNYDLMDPFFMTIVSDSDHWLFVSSNGSLTAGRRNSGNALFPYYTEDKIHDMAKVTGPKTICRVERDGEWVLWEPFSDRYRGLHRIERNLYKGEFGNQVRFEEINHDLGLAFSYSWKFSDKFGFVRESRIGNVSPRIVKIDLVDGLQNLLPAGVHPDFQLMFSSLGDAYKKNELESGPDLAIYSFSSVPGDKAEPMESLKANTCFRLGLKRPVVLISSKQLNAFRSGARIQTEHDMRGARGAYFVGTAFTLEPEAGESWRLVAEVNQGPAEVVNLLQRLGGDNLEKELDKELDADIRLGTERLRKIVGAADGLQKTRDVPGVNHHFANCMFNVMRGGIFQEGYAVDKQDLLDVVKRFNREAFAANAAWLEALPATTLNAELISKVAALGDARLERIVREYLPLSFSRRHGDPSRPWNIFSIDLKDDEGNRILAYQGNWRDIFQNWEALSLSFPEFAEGFIRKFLNSTTADGYNPYRLGKYGFDWEKPHANEPWAHIGYWGDHQLIYLLRLMEWSHKFNPGRLETLLRQAAFVYADVPYDIKPYEDLVKDPKHTIDYNRAREKQIQDRVDRLGIDGQYVENAKGGIHSVNLAEKLLVPLLAKVSNFIPGAGIWLNTQRPEWNDANNALAGFGLSMVTLYYARRYAAFLKDLVIKAPAAKIALSREVAAWLARTAEAMDVFGKAYLAKPGVTAAAVTSASAASASAASAPGASPPGASPAGAPHARGLVEPLGRAAAAYRKALYADSLSGDKTEIESSELLRFLDLTLAYADQAIRRNRRSDGLYHSYNVFNPETMEVRALYEMLEGQVAVLSSGSLDAREAIAVLEALRNSRMYRADQHSYMLYPDKELPRFIGKAVIPREAFAASPLFNKLVADRNTSLVAADIRGDLHFNGDLKNAGDLAASLDRLKAAGYAGLVVQEQEAILGLFEKVFDHQSFTGRSGTFFGYEGLGSIYWHMVSKLLLAVQENFFAALDAGLAAETKRLGDLYYDVRSGISFNKTPDVYGAFPSDPYSHTPAGAGAKQPGMTGQVKEEVITRLGELGVRMAGGAIRFQPALLRKSEFLEAAGSFEFFNAQGASESLRLPAGALAFTVCQVPVVYHLSDHSQVKLTRSGASSAVSDAVATPATDLVLSAEICRDLYGRTGKVTRIDVYIPRSILL